MRRSNENSGVATVASITLQKLVVPLKVLNIDDREFNLLKEIVLFNPGSGLPLFLSSLSFFLSFSLSLSLALSLLHVVNSPVSRRCV